MKTYLFALTMLLTTNAAASEFYFVPRSGMLKLDIRLGNNDLEYRSDLNDRTMTKFVSPLYSGPETNITHRLTETSDTMDATSDTRLQVVGPDGELHVKVKNGQPSVLFDEQPTFYPGSPYTVSADCVLPEKITSNLGNSDVTYKHVTTTYVDANTGSGPNYFQITCWGDYRRFIPLHLILDNNQLNLAGSVGNDMKAKTAIRLRGMESNVFVQLDNPSRSEIEVSFDELTEKTETTMSIKDINHMPLQSIYVTAIKPVPGHKEYRVTVNASYM
ncbi:hypothetical protein QUQ56_004734 [Escherichia coli]|nr:hypothetical protein [Escherichia coli]